MEFVNYNRITNYRTIDLQNDFPEMKTLKIRYPNDEQAEELLIGLDRQIHRLTDQTPNGRVLKRNIAKENLKREEVEKLNIGYNRLYCFSGSGETGQGNDVGSNTVSKGVPIIAIDVKNWLSAMHKIKSNPRTDITLKKIQEGDNVRRIVEDAIADNNFDLRNAIPVYITFIKYLEQLQIDSITLSKENFNINSYPTLFIPISEYLLNLTENDEFSVFKDDELCTIYQTINTGEVNFVQGVTEPTSVFSLLSNKVNNISEDNMIVHLPQEWKFYDNISKASGRFIRDLFTYYVYLQYKINGFVKINGNYRFVINNPDLINCKQDTKIGLNIWGSTPDNAKL